MTAAAAPVLTLDDLVVTLPVDGQPRPLIRGVSLTVAAGEAVALLGESGSGKSTIGRAVVGLLPDGGSATGAVRFDGRDVLTLTREELRAYRAADVGIVFQDPRAHVNPVRRVGDFLTEPLIWGRGLDRAAARRVVAGVLRDVGIPDAERRFRQYPHELSGGLLQRMMIASVIAMRPRLIVADEPTTALDATTQAEVMAILAGLRRDHGIALLLITHDLDLAAAVADRTAVLYAGTIVEERVSHRLYDDPLHPYSAALADSRPALARPGEPLVTIAGAPLSALEASAGCAFAPRCPHARPPCAQVRPVWRSDAGGGVACLRSDELRGHLRAGATAAVADA